MIQRQRGQMDNRNPTTREENPESVSKPSRQFTWKAPTGPQTTSELLQNFLNPKIDWKTSIAERSPLQFTHKGQGVGLHTLKKNPMGRMPTVLDTAGYIYGRRSRLVDQP